MFARPRRLVRALLIGAVFLGQTAVATAAGPSPAPVSNPAGAPPEATLVAEPAVLSASIEPGVTKASTLTLRARQALDVTIEPMGLGQSPDDGTFSFVTPDADVSPYSARTLIAVSPSTFHLQPGESRPVQVTIAMPDGTAGGERFALLKVNGQPASADGNVGIGVALGVSVVVSQPGAVATLRASLQGLQVAPFVAG